MNRKVPVNALIYFSITTTIHSGIDVLIEYNRNVLRPDPSFSASTIFCLITHGNDRREYREPASWASASGTASRSMRGKPTSRWWTSPLPMNIQRMALCDATSTPDVQGPDWTDNPIPVHPDGRCRLYLLMKLGSFGARGLSGLSL